MQDHARLEDASVTYSLVIEDFDPHTGDTGEWRTAYRLPDSSTVDQARALLEECQLERPGHRFQLVEYVTRQTRTKEVLG